MTGAKIKVEYWPIGRLKPYPNNPKDHPAEQIEELDAIVGECGFVNPILVDKNEEIIAGHGRLIVAARRKMETVPVIQLKHLSEAQAIALRIADNAIPARGTWSPEKLQIELDALSELNFDTSRFGFEHIELPDIAPEPDAPPARARTKTTIFLSVKNSDAAKAKKAVIAALKKAGIEHNL